MLACARCNDNMRQCMSRACCYPRCCIDHCYVNDACWRRSFRNVFFFTTRNEFATALPSAYMTEALLLRHAGMAGQNGAMRAHILPGCQLVYMSRIPKATTWILQNCSADNLLHTITTLMKRCHRIIDCWRFKHEELSLNENNLT